MLTTALHRKLLTLVTVADGTNTSCRRLIFELSVVALKTAISAVDVVVFYFAELTRSLTTVGSTYIPIPDIIN